MDTGWAIFEMHTKEACITILYYSVMSKMLKNYPWYIEKRSTDAQPQNEILRSWGLGGYP